MIWRLKPLTRYYIFGLVPVLVLTVVFNLAKVGFGGQIFFLLGFIWPYALFAPGVGERIDQSRYRFSFLKLIYKIDLFFERKLERLDKSFLLAIGRGLSPMLFCTVLFVITGQGNLLFTLLGWGLFELFLWITTKYNLIQGPQNLE